MNPYSDIPYYRTWVSSSLTKFRVVYKETDLLVMAEKDLTKEVLSLVREIRLPLEAYILKNPLFLKTLTPISVEPDAPEIVKVMAEASTLAGVGPMASVAGAIAEMVGKTLLDRGLTTQIVVENGGDIFLSLKKEARVTVFAGKDSPFSGKLALVIKPDFMPCGVCTSSKKIGHSLSFGNADALTVIHKNTALADALATAFGNMLKQPKDFDKIIKIASSINGFIGVLGILGENLFLWGKNLRLEPLI